jgi:peptidyl-prolyl cis-trans isomerase B (cyclophilin B)
VAGKKERQRKLARERYQRRLSRQAHRSRQAQRWTITGGIAVVVIALVVGGALFASRSSGTASTKASASTSPTPSTVAEPAHHCSYTVSGTAARKVSLPPSTPDYKATYTATISTNVGDIGISLLNSKATCTVNSFVSLAGQKYFNNTTCHRLTTSSSLSVLQCGDPTGTGSGGPGYKFSDENLKGATYKAGTLAMANAGANTNGSQFFLVYKDSSLPPNYTPFGTIVSGLNIIQNVAKAGTNNANGQGDGAPNEKVEINSVTVQKA